MIEERFAGVGGYNIFFRAWRPQVKERGVVVVAHGLKAHSGYYEKFAEQLASRGLAVYALDIATLPGVTVQSTTAQVDAAIKAHQLARATLTGGASK